MIKAINIDVSTMQASNSIDYIVPKSQNKPPNLWVGIGCTRGTSEWLIAQAIAETCGKFGLNLQAIAEIATIEDKANEVGLLDYCHHYGYPFRIFTRDQLRSVAVPNPSARVERQMVTPSVAEAAALASANNGQLTGQLIGKLRVPKQIFKSTNGSEAVTLAIAQTE
jgi:cobalt-precorrin 5A hydrolase/precorrin-3B C17-methyltransferase